MKIIKKISAVILFIIAFSGCAGNYMVTVPDNKIQKPSDDKATIVFMRSSFVSAATASPKYSTHMGSYTRVNDCSLSCFRLPILLLLLLLLLLL